MGGSGSLQPNRPKAKKPNAAPTRKPPQVLHISKKGEEESLDNQNSPKKEQELTSDNKLINSGSPSGFEPAKDSFAGIQEGKQSMADLLGPKTPQNSQNSTSKIYNQQIEQPQQELKAHTVDDFDFDEDAFLAALDKTEPVGSTGEIASGKVIAIESDGVYVDIGGKAPGFMPKTECGLGVINIKEKFPIGLEVEVLVTREQNADGMVTISCRALALRKSWDKVKELEKEGKVSQIIVNGFNRGGVTCDLEGLRGFIPRSQLKDGEKHEDLVGKRLGVAFLEVNPDTRKLVLSEKKAVSATRISELEIGQLIEGPIVAVKPYGFFVDLDGVSGLLHHSMITGGSLRSLREVFNYGEKIKALVTEIDPGRSRIGLNTALLESMPGELLLEKEKVMSEANERAQKARNTIREKETQTE